MKILVHPRFLFFLLLLFPQHLMRRGIIILSGALCMGPANSVFSQPPAYQVVTAPAAPSGYYFFSTYKIGQYDLMSKGYQMIVDGAGHTVYFNPMGICFDFKLQPNGLISYFFEDKFYLMDSTFTIIDSVACKNGIRTDLHDFQILGNGHYLLIGTEEQSMDLSAYPIFLRNGTPGSKHANVGWAVIQELDQNKKVVFEWHAKKYLNIGEADPYFLTDTLNISATHMNSIEVDNEGNILACMRNFNEVIKINRRTGAVIWRMGGNKNQFTFLNDGATWMGMHDARRLANGNLTLFDNGAGFDSLKHEARAVEYEVDEKLKTATLVWHYAPSPVIYSSARGNMHRMANGNSLVNYGETRNNQVAFSVVSPDGDKLFSIRFKDTLGCYRAFGYTALPWTLKRPLVRRIDSAQAVYLEAVTDADRWLWSDGRTTKMIRVTVPGNYFVYVPIGAGYISSERMRAERVRTMTSPRK